MARPRLNPGESEEDRAERRRLQRIECKRKFNATEKGKATHNAYHLKKRYGLTPEAYDKLFDQAGGKCEICSLDLAKSGQGVTGNVACVDHCHTTDRIRGILCRQCNSWLGRVNDNPHLAVSYLEKHERPTNLFP